MIINQLDDATYSGIGSVCFKVVYSKDIFKVNVSLIVFNNGKIKMSGGSPKTIGNDQDMKSFLHTLMKDLCAWLPFNIDDMPKICCLNGNFKLKDYSESHLQNHIQQNKGRFAHVVNPNIMNKGRRCAYKFYMFENRKFHLAIDYKGCIQVFAAVTFSELQNIVNAFLFK